MVSAAHGHTIIFTTDENFVFSYSFPSSPRSAEGAKEGACFHGPGGSCMPSGPLALKHHSSKVEMIGREIPGDLIQAEVLFECGFCASLK